MLGVLQAIINGQQPDMRAVHKLHELIVAGDLSADVSLETLARADWMRDCTVLCQSAADWQSISYCDLVVPLLSL